MYCDFKFSSFYLRLSLALLTVYVERKIRQQLNIYHLFVMISTIQLRGGADKSLARSGRKQATATKLGIYSTYSQQSSIHFLARCSNFCKPLKKKIWRLSVQQGIRGSNDLRVGRKIANFQLFFFKSREQVVVRRGQIRRIGWVINILEAQVGQFLIGCECPVSRGIVQYQDPLGDFPATFFLQNVLQLHRQRWLTLRVVWHRCCFWSAFRHFGPISRRAFACPNLHEWWTQPAHMRCPIAKLLI